MPNEIDIRVEGLDRVLKKLGRLGPAVYKPAIAEGAAHIKSVIAQYPPRLLGRKQPPKTLKQRLFLVWAFATGVLDFPYRRGRSPGSEALGRRWTVQFRDEGKTAIVGNNASYARFVHDPEDQSEFHKGGGWKTSRQVADEEAPTLLEIFIKHIRIWKRSK